MPAASDEPVAVAYSGDGTPGIALVGYQSHREDFALIIGQGGAGSPVVVPVADSSSITSDGTSGFIVGTPRRSLVSTAGTATPIAVPPASFIPMHTSPAISVLPDGNLAAITSAGVLEFPASASSVASAASALRGSAARRACTAEPGPAPGA